MAGVPSNQRPWNMSQVDWLWENYSPYQVSTTRSEVPSDSLLLTESAIYSMVARETSGIIELRVEDDPDNEDQILLQGVSEAGEVLSTVTLPKEEHITAFYKKEVTEEDIDDDSPYSIGDTLLIIDTNLGHSYIVDIGTSSGGSGGSGEASGIVIDPAITVELGSGVTVGGYTTGDVIEAGTSVQDVFYKLFTKQVPPTYTKPSMSLSLSPSTTTYEIGTSISNLAIGVNFTKNDAGDFIQCTLTSSDGYSLDTLTSTSDKASWTGIVTSSVQFSGTTSYEEGAIKQDNLGQDYPEGHIEAGTISASSTLSGVRYSFYKSSGDPIAYSTSDDIRNLGSSASNLKSGSVVNVTIHDGDMYVVFAYPKSLGNISSILQQTSNLDVKGSFDIDTVSVEGAEGYEAVDYYVYHYAALTGLNADTFTVTI